MEHTDYKFRVAQTNTDSFKFGDTQTNGPNVNSSPVRFSLLSPNTRMNDPSY